jgi:hypothetical protein
LYGGYKVSSPEKKPSPIKILYSGIDEICMVLPVPPSPKLNVIFLSFKLILRK